MCPYTPCAMFHHIVRHQHHWHQLYINGSASVKVYYCTEYGFLGQMLGNNDNGNDIGHSVCKPRIISISDVYTSYPPIPLSRSQTKIALESCSMSAQFWQIRYWSVILDIKLGVFKACRLSPLWKVSRATEQSPCCCRCSWYIFSISEWPFIMNQWNDFFNSLRPSGAYMRR